jgi:NADPH-dependent 7-cyano-7-deazaguanine reductase QueF
MLGGVFTQHEVQVSSRWLPVAAHPPSVTQELVCHARHHNCPATAFPDWRTCGSRHYGILVPTIGLHSWQGASEL